MSSIPWKLDKDLCRCCHAEGSFHNLSEPGYHLGQFEDYLDMLKILGLNLTPLEDMPYVMTYTICQQCVTQLRHAATFKQQVLRCEEQFQEIYAQYLQGLKSQVKAEPSTDEMEEVKQEIELETHEFDMTFTDSTDDDKPLLKKLLIGYPTGNKTKTPATPKTKVKTKKLLKKRKSPKKSKESLESESEVNETGVGEEGEEAGDAEKQEKKSKKKAKGEVRRHPKFVLRATDYRQEGAELACAHCDKRYDKILSLRFHLKTKHYNISRYFCQYCDQGFLTQAPLTVHKLDLHKIDERFKCKACNAAFNTNVQLRKHVNNFHMLGQKYKCDACDYESFSFEGLYKHKFKHKTVKDYHCKFCRKSFLRKATLDLHERIHTGDRRKVCQVCSQAFVQKASLNYHMTKYHPEVNF